MLLKNINKIVVFRALQIGDMMCCVPAIRALHHAYPNTEITLVGLPWANMLVERFNDYFHRLITFPGYPGFPEQSADYHAFPEFLKGVQSEEFDLALQMQGNGKLANALVELFAAKKIAGFCTENAYRPGKGLFLEYPDQLHEIYRHLKLMELLGIAEYTTNLEFTITKKDEEDFAKATPPVIPHRYVVIHPGSRGVSRQWNPEFFAFIADKCYEKGLQVIVTGTADETEIVEKVISFMQHPSINAAGKTSLGAVAVLIRDAALLVSNCTGVSHIASALQTKSIVISLDGEPYRWAPLNTEIHKSIDGLTHGIDYVEEQLNELIS